MHGDKPGVDGIPTGGRLIPIDPNDPSKGSVNVTCGTATHVCHGGGGYSTSDGKFKPGASSGKYPYGPQDDKYSYAHGAKGVAINMFSREQLPVKGALSDNYGPSRAKSAPRSFRRVLLTPHVHPGSLYRCGNRT